MEIIPPANPLVPLAAPPDRARYRGHDERPPARYRHRTFHEELSRPDAAYTYSRDENGTHVRAARLDEQGRLLALVVDVEQGREGPRTSVAVVRENVTHNAGAASLLQPGRLINIVV